MIGRFFLWEIHPVNLPVHSVLCWSVFKVCFIIQLLILKTDLPRTGLEEWPRWLPFLTVHSLLGIQNHLWRVSLCRNSYFKQNFDLYFSLTLVKKCRWFVLSKGHLKENWCDFSLTSCMAIFSKNPHIGTWWFKNLQAEIWQLNTQTHQTLFSLAKKNRFLYKRISPILMVKILYFNCMRNFSVTTRYSIEMYWCSSWTLIVCHYMY